MSKNTTYAVYVPATTEEKASRIEQKIMDFIAKNDDLILEYSDGKILSIDIPELANLRDNNFLPLKERSIPRYQFVFNMVLTVRDRSVGQLILKNFSSDKAMLTLRRTAARNTPETDA